MAINNNMCERCSKGAVCKIEDILAKFHEDAKNPFGVDITIDSCVHFVHCEEVADS